MRESINSNGGAATLAHGIIWSCAATGAEFDEFAEPKTVEEAQRDCGAMIGQPVFFHGKQVGVVESAYPGNAEGDYV